MLGHHKHEVWNNYDFFNVLERGILCSLRLHLFDKNTLKTVIL